MSANALVMVAETFACLRWKKGRKKMELDADIW
jgi:hypothetical protein